MLRWAALVAALGVAVPAHAGDARDDADEHARRGVALYKLGRYADAIGEFEQAYLLYPSDMLLYNLGQSHRQLDHCREALDYYRRFLDAQPQSPLAGKVGALIPPLEHACEIKYAKPVDVASSAAPPPPPPAPAAEPEPEQPAAAEPERSSAWRLSVGLGAGVVMSGGGTVVPVGPRALATREVLEGRLELGGHAAVGWFAGDQGMVGAAVSVAAVAGRSVQRGDLELRFAGGPGIALLAAPARALMAGGRTARSPVVAPELVALAALEYPVAPRWVAAIDADVEIGASSALRAGMVSAAAVSLAIGYRP